MGTYLLSALHFHQKITSSKSSLEWSLVCFCLNTRLVGATAPPVSTLLERCKTLVLHAWYLLP